MFSRRVPTSVRTRSSFSIHHHKHRRAFHLNSPALYPRKDTQDRESMNTEPTEYSKSGSDTASAGDSAAFDPSQTRPEQQQEAAGQQAQAQGGEKKDSSLDVSPANPEVSKPRGAGEGQPEGSEGETGSGSQSGRNRTSGGGSGPKSGGGQHGGSGSGV